MLARLDTWANQDIPRFIIRKQPSPLAYCLYTYACHQVYSGFDQASRRLSLLSDYRRISQLRQRFFHREIFKKLLLLFAPPPQKIYHPTIAVQNRDRIGSQILFYKLTVFHFVPRIFFSSFQSHNFQKITITSNPSSFPISAPQKCSPTIAYKIEIESFHKFCFTN